jgi:large subunit ribosomal protein L10e
MAKVRKAVAYRRLERPYTRVSKFREKTFIRISPNPKIIRFGIGDAKKKFEYNVDLISNKDLQIRDSAIESARQTSNRLLEKTIGPNAYYFKIRVYPHHVLRENPLAAGAGADRFSTGMSHSFGKPIGIASRVKKGQKLITISVDKIHLDVARQALKRASAKLPCSCSIKLNENK